MSATLKVYAKFLADAVGSASGGGAPNCDWLSDTIKCALLTSSYTPDQAAHEFFSDLTNELTGGVGGYTSGGATLGSKTLSTTGLVTTFDADDPSWPTATFTCRYAAIYDDTPSTAGTKPLIAIIDLGQNYSPANGTFTVQFNASGIFTVTCA